MAPLSGNAGVPSGCIKRASYVLDILRSPSRNGFEFGLSSIGGPLDKITRSDENSSSIDEEERLAVKHAAARRSPRQRRAVPAAAKRGAMRAGCKRVLAGGASRPHSVEGMPLVTIARGALSATALGVKIGVLPAGRKNAITDVKGVAVGHCTVTSESNPSIQTGVTVVLPHQKNTFVHKVVASCHVINGFGKSTGLVQIQEMGQLESPIALTNTFSIPAVTDGLLDALLKDNPGVGESLGSVNTVVAECNDSLLNDMRGRHVRPQHVRLALRAASTGPVVQGDVGAGRGMSAFGLKGGIGTASRLVGDLAPWTVGVLVLSNFCQLGELMIAGRPVGKKLESERLEQPRSAAGGSIIVVVGTDAPITDRQLARLLRRVQNGLARTGSATAHNSGEIAIGFTSYALGSGAATHGTDGLLVLADDGPSMDPLFQAVGEATEEAVLNSLFNAHTVVGRNGVHVEGFPTHRLDELMAS